MGTEPKINLNSINREEMLICSNDDANPVTEEAWKRFLESPEVRDAGFTVDGDKIAFPPVESASSAYKNTLFRNVGISPIDADEEEVMAWWELRDQLEDAYYHFVEGEAAESGKPVDYHLDPDVPTT